MTARSEVALSAPVSETDLDEAVTAGPAGRRVVQSVERACTIIHWLASRDSEGSVSEFAQRLGVHKSTVSRLLATLEEAGMVERDEHTGCFHLGLGCVSLAGAVLGQLEILRIADPPLRRLAGMTHETVNLAVRYGHQIMNIEQIPGADISRSLDWIGKTAPLHQGAAAKAFLAHLPEAEIRTYLATTKAAHGNLNPALLWRDLIEIRTRGFSINRGEHDDGVYAVGAPIFDDTSACRASISIAGHQHEFTETRITELGGQVAHTALTISQQLGYRAGRFAPIA